jgi:hypothetical protein
VSDVQRGYVSFLLRLWETNDQGESRWRASLERPRTGERHGFASLQDLFAFLEAQTSEEERHGQSGDVCEV